MFLPVPKNRFPVVFHADYCPSALGCFVKTAVDAFNTAVGSFERRVLPMGQKLESLKVAEQTKRRLGAPQMLTEETRTVTTGTGEDEG